MRFLSKTALNQPPTDEIMALIPTEQTRSKELAEQGIVESVYIAADQSAAWMVWICNSRAALDEFTKTLPLYEFLNIDITPLADEGH